MTWMVYGANGYTGQLVAELAVGRGESPVLAGRSERKIAPLAAALGLDHRVFDLGDAQAVRAGLDGIDVVAHCAGPYSATGAPMVEGCLATGTHYVDITGEIDVFEAIFRRHDEARERGVVLLPGSGFDVVPSDCLAASLAAELPEATHLELAFASGGGMSPGTLRTTVEGMGTGGRARVDGKLVDVPMAHSTVTADFPSGSRRAIALPWGDVATAYRSTSIPNIVTYISVPLSAKLVGGGQRLFAPIMRTKVGQRLGKDLVGLVSGPGEKRRRASKAEFWGRVRDGDGRSVALTMITPNGYSLTADATVRTVLRLLEGKTAPGAHTPATAFGKDFVRELDGVTMGEPTVKQK